MHCAVFGFNELTLSGLVSENYMDRGVCQILVKRKKNLFSVNYYKNAQKNLKAYLDQYHPIESPLKLAAFEKFINCLYNSLFGMNFHSFA